MKLRHLQNIYHVIIDANSIVQRLTQIKNGIMGNVNSSDKKLRYKMNYYILLRFLLAAILLFSFVIICYHYAEHSLKQKRYWHINSIKREKNNKLKILLLKTVGVINSMAYLKSKILIVIIFYWMKNHMKIFCFVTF